MPETFEPLHESFSIADADAPCLIYTQGLLHVRFKDWREQEVELRFFDVIAFSWDEGEAALDKAHRDDASYLVIGSEWLKRHIDVNNVYADERHHHYKLCFNAAGILQVLAQSLKVST